MLEGELTSGVHNSVDYVQLLLFSASLTAYDLAQLRNVRNPETTDLDNALIDKFFRLLAFRGYLSTIDMSKHGESVTGRDRCMLTYLFEFFTSEKNVFAIYSDFITCPNSEVMIDMKEKAIAGYSCAQNRAFSAFVETLRPFSSGVLDPLPMCKSFENYIAELNQSGKGASGTVVPKRRSLLPPREWSEALLKYEALQAANAAGLLIEPEVPTYRSPITMELGIEIFGNKELFEEQVKSDTHLFLPGQKISRLLSAIINPYSITQQFQSSKAL